MAAIEMIKAQQALAKARADQHAQRLQKIAATRARNFAPVRAFVQELMDAGAIYTRYPGAYTAKASPLAEVFADHCSTLGNDFVRFANTAWGEHVIAACHWPSDEYRYPGGGAFYLIHKRDHPYKDDPTEYFSKVDDLIERLAAKIQKNISFPEPPCTTE